MRWSEVTASPGNKLLRQFAGLCLVIFGGLAAYRAWRGQVDAVTIVMGVAGLVIGLVGLVWPAAVRWVYTGWMIVAFRQPWKSQAGRLIPPSDRQFNTSNSPLLVTFRKAPWLVRRQFITGVPPPSSRSIATPSLMP